MRLMMLVLIGALPRSQRFQSRNGRCAPLDCFVFPMVSMSAVLERNGTLMRSWIEPPIPCRQVHNLFTLLLWQFEQYDVFLRPLALYNPAGYVCDILRGS